MLNRRDFIGSLTLPAGAAAFAGVLLNARWAEAAEALAASSDLPDKVAGDEALWLAVSQAFTVDRSITNLNNGGVSPSPAVVQTAMRRHLDYSNTAPARTMWVDLEPQRETVRAALATAWGVDKEEVALTRNASESLQTCQFGFDLRPGDEVLTTNQDYPRMITTFKQRERREKIVLKQFSIPTPCEDPAEIVARFEKNITERTRLILVSHMVFMTGQVLPAGEVAALGRRRGIPVIVDGAHSFAQVNFKIPDLDCDYFASSLHKWLFAPHGTGLLYVRRDKIAGLWPLMAAEAKQDGDIRKFEEIGTHPAANALAVAEALAFHESIGGARKAARLVYLRDFWARRLQAHDRVRFHTSLKPGFAGGMAVVEIDGIDPSKLTDWLWSRHRILTTPIIHDEFKGIRVSPSLYTLLPELDRFCVAMEQAIRKGIEA